MKKSLCLHKIRDDVWEVWFDGDKESDDLSCKEVAKLIVKQLHKQCDGAVLYLKNGK